ncbi:MAG: DUF4439 domain-containing protein [Aeromicrobium sp.]
MSATEAMQAWLALEHEAVWLHPVLGARFDALRDRATASFTAHRATRDTLLQRLRTAGADPVRAELVYDVGPLATAAEAVAAAQALEAKIAAACLALVRDTEDDDRGDAIRSLTKAALAELTWDGAAQAFPGLP